MNLYEVTLRGRPCTVEVSASSKLEAEEKATEAATLEMEIIDVRRLDVPDDMDAYKRAREDAA